MFWLNTSLKFISDCFYGSLKALRPFAILFLFIYLSISYINTSYGQGKKSINDYNPNTGNISYDSLTSPYFIVKEIRLIGNQKTKLKIILREIGLQVGDTIYAENVQEQLIWIKNRLFNTTLFLWTDVSLSSFIDSSIFKILTISMRERAYFIPIPEAGLGDRNFNEWWQDRNHDLRRLDYGLNLKIKNIWGLNHSLVTKLIYGFNKKLEVSYAIPYINKNYKTGLIIKTLVVLNRQVAYETFEHKLAYVEPDRYGRIRYNLNLFFTRRNKFYMQHQLRPTFQYTQIADTVSQLNQDYFLQGSSNQTAYGLKYILTHDKRDFANYPLKGYLLKLEADAQYLIAKKYLGVAAFRAELTHFTPISKRFYFAFSSRTKLSSPQHQPYFSQRGLGYDKEWVNGYERYVIDGQAFGLVKTNIKYRLFSINPHLKFLPFRKFRTVPLSAYLKVYSDAGYVVDNTHLFKNNFLTNRLLAGGGVGIDLVTYYDMVGRIEYSINQLGETGIYLHLKAGF
jgi:outer membrane protein assembly factor BamA